MSDSETDTFPSNIYTFRNETTMVSAKGPNINNTNITGLNFRSNLLSSTMQPRNFERQRYTDLCDQRSMYYRRETSPMSMYSGSDVRPRNFHNSLYPRMSSQRSIYSGRGGSPVSMRSLDSNASVSAVDIAMAFKNVNFNKYDLRIIKDAYNKLMKRKVRKKIEKRRNMRLFLKGYRRKSGYDSGELGSDSSISSSDDCRSTNSALCRDNMSSCRSTRTDITNFRQTITQSNMYNDCTNNFKNDAFKNMLSLSSNNTREITNRQKYELPAEIQNIPKTISYVPRSTKLIKNIAQDAPCQKKTSSIQNVPTTIKKATNMTQKVPSLNLRDRFKNSFLLPSQRFNKSIASVPIPEKDNAHPKSSITSNSKGKRSLDMEDIICSEIKRQKLSSQQQIKSTSKQSNNRANILTENNNKDTLNNKKTDDFDFVKPKLPVRKSGPIKVKEMLISKSNVPLTDAIITPPTTVPKENIDNSKQEETVANATKNIIIEKTSDNQADAAHLSSELSMRPSFIKRKLFTQKMDVTESKNLSTDVNINSPQNDVYSVIQREKHKARKLVTNQSCLSRDINQEDSNLIDLIHKIVPPDRMSMTSNKTCLGIKTSLDNKHDDDDKWDVTSIISICNNDDGSDTYTDEEIFKDNKKPKLANIKKKTAKNPNNTSECRVVLEKMPNNQQKEINDTDNNKTSVYSCAKNFWDTDFESDFETTGPNDSSMKGNITKSTNSIIKCRDNSNVPQLHNFLKQESAKQIAALVPEKGTLKKYNVAKNLTIKAFGTPNNANTKSIVNRKVSEKNESLEKSLKVTNKKQNIAKKTDTKKTKMFTSNKKTEPKKPPEYIELKEMDEAKEPGTENKNKSSNIRSKSKSNVLNKTNMNANISRSQRTPKAKVCCDDPKLDKSNTKANNTKLKPKTTKKINNATADKENTTQVINRKRNILAVEQTVMESEPMNRTLRTRTVNLSSSFNTSNENITNITVKSLRTRQINLSSSMDNSISEENHTALRKKLQKPTQKKTNLKSNYSVGKKQRYLRNVVA